MEKEEQLLYDLAGKPVEEKVIQINDRVYFFRGYGGNNVVLAIGENECVLVDAAPQDAAAERIKKEIEKITDKPIRTIFYTHKSHNDHSGGAAILAAEGATIVGARAVTPVYGYTNLIGQIAFKRLMDQVGATCTLEERITIGLFPATAPEGNVAELPITEWIDEDTKTFEIDGIKIQVWKVSGETDDHLFVYLVDDGVFCCGDNYYLSWPNLSTPRGSQYRDISSWIDSLQIILDVQPQYLANGHSDLISGKENVAEVIGNYKGAIEYVLTEGLKAINEGLTIQQVVEKVVLPEEYKKLPYLTELYGMVEWTLRGAFCGYLGWYDGNPTNLHFQPVGAQAKKRVALAGGAANVVAEAEKALAAGDYQWVMEICDDLINAEEEVAKAKALKADALDAAAHRTVNASTRHFYMEGAKALRK